jgi:flagellar biosynthetic protein FliP
MNLRKFSSLVAKFLFEIAFVSLLALALSFLFKSPSAQAAVPIPKIDFGISQASKPQEVASSIQILFLLTVLSLAPALLIMVTSFTRIVIVLSFVRNALGTQQVPPSSVLIGLALFLTFFVMAPVFVKINNDAMKPFLAGKLDQTAAFKRAETPIRDFMLRQTGENDLALFVHLAKLSKPKNADDVPTYVVVPSFIISELKKAFLIGFLIYIPFLIIDMVVASTLMSMGMMMLPPILISLPIKLLLFVLVDGWNLIARALVLGFR